MRELILGTVSDSMSNLLYYDRKEDGDLPIGAIEQAIKDGVVSVDDILNVVRENLINL